MQWERCGDDASIEIKENSMREKKRSFVLMYQSSEWRWPDEVKS